MTKRYSEFMDEISSDQLYEKLLSYGMIFSKLPPFFQSVQFYEYYKKQTNQHGKKERDYIVYDNMRNIHIPRPIGIPNPFTYEYLCRTLRDNWDKIQEHFQAKTGNQEYCVSRIHIRLMKDFPGLFQMNYQNWQIDGTPEPDLALGKKYVVNLDISQCYPSIYSHAVPWALVGKEEAKKTKREHKIWYNELDFALRNIKNGETHGVLIGPDVSSIIAEIILCSVDKQLSEQYEYIRHIDDYECYTESYEDAERFILDVNRELKVYGLSLNHKKTKIIELPVGSTKKWKNQIAEKIVYFEKFQPYVDYREVKMFLDMCIELAREGNDAAILNYALKILGKYTLTKNAKTYVVKTFVSLALLYGYIVPLLGEYIFDKYNLSSNEVQKYIELIYNKYIDKDRFEACAYAIYYAIKNECEIVSIDIDKIITKNDCILLCSAWIYFKKYQNKAASDKLKEHAKQLQSNDEMDKYWLFLYEVLPKSVLKNEWKELKNNKISFLKDEYISLK